MLKIRQSITRDIHGGKNRKLKQKSCILRMISESVATDNFFPILNYLPFEKLGK